MVKLLQFISCLKVCGLYTEIGSSISRTGTTPGTITHNLASSGPTINEVYPYPEFRAKHTASWEADLNTKLSDNTLSVDSTLHKLSTFNQFSE